MVTTQAIIAKHIFFAEESLQQEPFCDTSQTNAVWVVLILYPFY